MFKKIINTCLLASVVVFLSFFSEKGVFKASQLKNTRVKVAYGKKWPGLQSLLTSVNVDTDNFDLYLRVFKAESQLEVFVKNKKDKKFQLLKTFAVCAKSGVLGPKRQQGDGQVPEGFYEISAFNPVSSYHLSLKVSYPNKSDVIKAVGNAGGDIMIHGECVTIGCIPLQNEPIEELYVMCVEAKNSGGRIKTDIFPFRMTEANLLLHKNGDVETLRFWTSLKKAFSYFETNKSLPVISIDKAGSYNVDPSL